MRKILFPIVAAIALWTMTPLAHAQQMGNQPFSFRVHNNPYAANLAIVMRNLQNGNGNSSSGTTASPGGAGSYVVNNYSSNTVGTLNEISQILDNGSSAYLGAKVDQGQTGAQSSATEGHQTVGDINNGNSAPASSEP
jgi:hypothetical protein